MRLIDGDALIEKFNKKVDMEERIIDARTAERFATFCALADAVEEMPTADAEVVVHGTWEAKGYVCGESEFECSVCHETEWRTSISRFRWCPFCGARMDGDSDAKES